MLKRKSKFLKIIVILFISAASLNAKIDELNLKSDHGSYNEAKKIFFAQGNAHIIIDNNEIFCDEMEIHLTKDDNVEKAIFKRNIRIFQEKEKIQIGGEYAEYYKKDKQFVIRDNAFYADVEEEVAVFGDSIYNYDKEKIAIVQGNARIYQKDIYAKGASVKYTRKDKLMEISGFPTVENQGSTYNAKKIIVNVEANTFYLEGGIDAIILNEEKEEDKKAD
ncbi:MAG TPA: LptA/OstA family protein [Spirochaetota bacterium]|jgi:lipopolysaccharide export system protein LptA|nr:MAG: LPS-assembly protein LptD [Spirochaetes bacterium ADurb.Bin133]HOF00497.1 LptA/OstA family protein [Spirochaetota bacterium]HOS33048.1 LptA/OstA family protein [Spirochaetota bacterium]HOS55523.1 LptA/OstA family protein [Spirochaetota bacterium]HPK62577.1 LptA/OstA family protein [Spirochaetota bacterium]